MMNIEHRVDKEEQKRTKIWKRRNRFCLTDCNYYFLIKHCWTHSLTLCKWIVRDSFIIIVRIGRKKCAHAASKLRSLQLTVLFVLFFFFLFHLRSYSSLGMREYAFVYWINGWIAVAMALASVVSVLMNCFYWKWSAEMIQIRQHSIYYIHVMFPMKFCLAIVFHLFSIIIINIVQRSIHYIHIFKSEKFGWKLKRVKC